MRKAVLYLLLAISLSAGLQAVYISTAFSAEVVEQWRAEFDTVCGQTDGAADMSIEELKKALEKCDALKPKIEALEATPRKVYLKRLQMCRNLFVYLLEGKEKK